MQAFKKHSQLTLHLKRHSGEAKPFKCDEDGCNSSFMWPSELRRHQKFHNGVCCTLISRKWVFVVVV